MTVLVQCPLVCCSPAGQLSVLQGRGFLSSPHSSSPQLSRKKMHPGNNQAAESCHSPTELRATVLSWAAAAGSLLQEEAAGLPPVPVLIPHTG